MNRSALMVTVLPPFAWALFMCATARPPWDAMRIAGLVLSVVGMFFLTVSRIQLGNSFSITPQARVLVTHGIYSRVRHPVYVSGAVAVAGLVLYLRRPLLLLVLLAIVPMQVLRARQEERVLEARFGDEYRLYRRSTWF